MKNFIKLPPKRGKFLEPPLAAFCPFSVEFVIVLEMIVKC